MRRTKTQTGRLTAFTYIRVSSDGQLRRTGAGEEGLSPPAQRAECSMHAESLGVTILQEFKEEGRSARSIDGRPALQALMKRVEQGDIDYVIVHKSDRLARDAETLAAFGVTSNNTA